MKCDARNAVGGARDGMWLVRELGAGSGEQGKREHGARIVIRYPKIDYFHQK